MSETNTNLYRAEQVRAMDEMAIHTKGIAGIDLMQRAGAAAFALLLESWPDADGLAVFCGTGNNGGDGYVIARLAHEQGLQVSLYQLGDHGKLKGDALTAANALCETDVPLISWQDGQGIKADVIVDALLGTGLNGEVSGHYREAIEAINDSNIPVLAVDIPSGLHADTGAVLGDAVKAQQTISFIGMKQGLYTGQAADHVGELHFADLGVPAEIYTHFTASASVIDYDRLEPLLAPRPRTTHKGQAGHVLIIGGNHGFSGAVRMAGEAAMRAGAGLVTIATRTEHAGLINIGRPELMVHGVEQGSALMALIDKADVLAIGPGLDQDDWARRMFAAVLEGRRPTVVDADGLNLLAPNPLQQDNWILTPHPGEAAHLLKCSTEAINADRFAAVQRIQQQYGATVVLKGAGSLVQSADGAVAVCPDGNPGMASGGMGDVLTGIIAGLWGQGLGEGNSARLGVCIHATAADMAVVADGERGLLASDLMPWIRRLVNP